MKRFLDKFFQQLMHFLEVVNYLQLEDIPQEYVDYMLSGGR